MEECEINYKDIYGSDDYLNILKLADGKLYTDDGCTFQIHRIILYKSSNYFRGLFLGLTTERKEFSIPGISGKILSDILSYIYTGDVSVNEKNFTDLMIAADYLLLDNLLLKVETFARNNLTLDNCVSTFLASHMTSKECLQREIFRFIQMHFEKIINDQKCRFTEIPFEILKQFLLSNSLNITSERTLWMAIVKWVKVDVQRQAFVPDLLSCLKKGELDENLARDIMEHNIVTHNSFCEDLHLQKFKTPATNYLNIVLQFLQNKLGCPIDNYNYRIPPRMYIISLLNKHGRDDEYSDVYVTYDENLDFWRKITKIDFLTDILLTINPLIFMFECETDRCLAYDMRSKNKIQFGEIFTQQRYNVGKALNIDHKIYILQYQIDELSQTHKYYIHIYDTLYPWIKQISLPNIIYANITSISKNLYVFGCNKGMNSMTAEMYYSVSDTWSMLPLPRIIRRDFAFAAFHEKLYVIGGFTEIGGRFLRNVEMFDPVTNEWIELPDLPYAYKSPRAIVLNDNIIVYDKSGETWVVRWDEARAMWENLKGKALGNDLYLYRFGLVEDAEFIRFLFKENKKCEFMESPFCLKEISTKQSRF